MTDAPSLFEVPLPVTSSLPTVGGSAARHIHQHVVATLKKGNECALIAAMLHACRSLSPLECPFASWLPCIIGLDERAQQHQPLPSTDAILKFIRENLRTMLVKFPLNVVGRWLVPASGNDTTAAYAGSFLLTQRGVLARPWLWDGLPKGDACMVISTTRRGAQKREHAQCIGHTTLIDLYPRTLPPLLPID